MLTPKQVYEEKKRRLEELQQKRAQRKNLPHIYLYRFYKWARKFFESRNKINLLCAANQVGKTSVQIRKAIYWATEVELWPKLWPHKLKFQPDFRPVFWYLYPDRDTATEQYYQKWEGEFLPRGEMREHPRYGWTPEFDKDKKIYAIHFNTGCSIYFKSYSKQVKMLQSGTIAAIFCFTKDAIVKTASGPKPIDQISYSDWVFTGSGHERPDRIVKREVPVVRREFSNGMSLTGTADHPFHTMNRGKIAFIDLTPEDQLVIVPGWKLHEKLHYLKAFCSTVNCSRVKSTPESTSWKSGAWRGNTNSSAAYAVSSSNQGHRSGQLQDFAPRSVARRITSRLSTVWFAASRRLCEKILPPVTVLPGAERLGKRTVYNLTLPNNHSYFVNGVMVANCDEELPEHLYNELQARLTDTDGFFHMVFTATLGQEMWRRAMEEQGTAIELFKEALKIQVSLYRCLRYEDGTKTPWTYERIKQRKARMSTKAEILRRIYGRFVKDSGLKFSEFTRKRNMVDSFELPKSWDIVAGVDVGSGGSAHPGAIAFIAADEKRREFVVFRGWKGGYEEKTTAGDIYQKFKDLREDIDHNRHIGTFYDYAAADFKTIADRDGSSVIPADKSHERGERILNSCFKLGILKIVECEELYPLVVELETLDRSTAKTKAKDDYCDALRYGFLGLNVDWAHVFKKAVDIAREKRAKKTRHEPERGFDYGSYEKVHSEEDGLECEFAECNAIYGVDTP